MHHKEYDNMVDIVSITTAIQGIKAATEIVQSIRSADQSLASAEQKLILADLVSALADSKTALSNVQDYLHEKDKEIARLKESLALRKELIRHGETYYEASPKGFPVGDPYCSHCFEVKGIAVHINQLAGDRSKSICPSCKTKIRRHGARDGSKPNA
tara:strand:+ start:376 stop:846 length:471 start_codon:yes stop_codon:yes gene_type:complete